MNENRSVATLDNPEFIDIVPFNPLISKCTIKVLYLGQNRNHSYIDKNTAIQMANSLPATPIVAAFREDKDDFGDHGDVITIEDGEVKFSCKTVPYGFVAPDARVWFQKFIDTDKFGNETEREYMMTTGYLWTGQYEEAQKMLEGKGQSMELENMDGSWAEDSKTNVEFFIINDAVFSKLCVLGDDVEPCFEGASIIGENKQYTKTKDFTVSLYTMMNELRDALGAEGGLNMPEKEVEELESAATEFAAKKDEKKEEATEPKKEEKPAEGEDAKDGEGEESKQSEEDKKKKSTLSEDSEDFAKKEDEEKKEEAPAKEDEPKKEEKPAEDSGDSAPKEDEEKKEKKPAAKSELEENSNAAILAELEELRAFKLRVENAEKDALIAKYHMLSEEDKAEVIAHKEEFSLEQIDEKLALVYVKKNVDFSTVDGRPEIEEDVAPVTTFSLDDIDAEDSDITADAMHAALRQMFQ